MLLFTFNLSAYSANAKLYSDKIPRYGYATSMTTPGIDYGPYLDDYDMSVIDYNTVTM